MDIAFSTIDSTEVYEQTLCGSSAASGTSMDIGGPVWVCGTDPPTIALDASLSTIDNAFETTCASACSIGSYWACVGHVNWGVPASSTCTISYWLKDFVTGAAVNGALVQVCPSSDCTQPLTYGNTDVNGHVSLTFQNVIDSRGHGLNSFLQVTSQDIVPFVDYWGFPLVEAKWPFWYGETVTPAENQRLSSDFGATLDPKRGQVAVVALDCLNQGAPGVHIALSSADALTLGFSTTGTPTTATDQTGVILFDNVPAGTTQITATPATLKEPSSQASVFVQPGTSTTVSMWPTPNP